MMRESLHPPDTVERPRLHAALAQLADVCPERVIAAVTDLGIADDRMAVATASVILCPAFDRTGLAVRRTIIDQLSVGAEHNRA